MAEEEAPKISAAPGYVGSYGKLTDFLRTCRENRVTTPAQYLELLAAVDDICRHSAHGKVSADQLHFAGSEEEFEHVLSAFDISTRNTKKEAKDDKKSYEADVDSEFGVVWGAPGFDCRSRGDVRVDAPALAYGFSAPYDLVSRYDIDTDVLQAWISAIGEQYLATNPYHNWQHACDVYQFCYVSLTDGRPDAQCAGSFLNYQDIMALLAAGIAHDVGHPGTNNVFLVNTSDELAIKYNDKSPLENMHASVAFRTLFMPGMNFLQRENDHGFKVFREKFVAMILATDASHHFELVDMFHTRCQGDSFVSGTKDKEGDSEKRKASKADRRILLQAFIHMADVGNCCRPWGVYKNAVVNLEAEFFAQGDKERVLGVPILPLMDRKKDSLASAQGFWIEKFVGPLLSPYCNFISPSLAASFQENAALNKQSWADRIAEHGKKTAAELMAIEEGSPPAPPEEPAA